VIDLHTHILPGLDDGARTLDESLAMARTALADGITTLAATPHDTGVVPDYPSRVRAQTAQLQAALEEGGLDVRLVPGSELYAVPDLVGRLRAGRALTLGSSRYFLLEFPLTDLPIFAAQLVFEAQVAGFTPIVAHPARTAAIQHDPNQLYELVERGVLAQITSGSLTGAFGPQIQATARILVEHNLAHLIASDAHGTGYRAPRISEGVRVAERIVGEETAQAMVTTRPQAILSDQPITVAPPRRYRRRRRWFWSHRS
jgi:protein-tyrosine phosphatase